MSRGATEYGLPLLLALLLHVVAAGALLANWNPKTQERAVIKPQIINSTLIVMEPKAKPAPPKPAPAVTQPLPKPVPKPEPPKPEPPKPQPKPEPKPKPEPPKPDLEAERRKAEELARQERLAAQAEAQFLNALEREAAAQADQAQAAEEAAAEEAEADSGAEATLAQSYQMGIYQAVVGNWSRPPSARNRMEAKLLVELVPTGDVVSVTVITSSGDAAFDRSAEAAVRKARRFEVPKEPDVFERHFRRFTLLFRPEDLLR